MQLASFISKLQVESLQISQERQTVLLPLIKYSKRILKEDRAILLNFVCTHNSRRSQLSQIWAQTAADFFGIRCLCFSSGVEITAFNKRAMEALESVGFGIQSSEGTNPKVLVSNNYRQICCYSKLINDEINPKSDFAAVMTCSHADENCPVVLGMEQRIALNYEDPGAYDGTTLEQLKYLERSEQIAAEMFFVFSQLAS